MAEKAVIIGLFASLLGTAGVLWAKMPPRPEIHYRTVGQTIAQAPETRVIPIDRIEPPTLPEWTKLSRLSPIPQQEPKEVMPSDTNTNIQHNNSNNIPDTRPRQVPMPRPKPVGAVNRPHCICKAVVRRIYVLPQANGGTL